MAAAVSATDLLDAPGREAKKPRVVPQSPDVAKILECGPPTPVSAMDAPDCELPRPPQTVVINKDLCDHTIRMLRAHSTSFSRVDKEDEPPLRVLELGLHGEAVVVPENEEPPYPYMIERPGRRFFHGYRFDQNVVDEQVHSTDTLRRVFGLYDPRADCFFRKTIGYQSKSGEFATLDNGVLCQGLYEALLPAALKVFGEEQNPAAARVSYIYSLYANLCLPGHIINLHLDVPEFAGVDRSTCPNWLLVCAHCSGLFADQRVRNVTCVFYPRSAPGGALAAYPAITRDDGANAVGAAVYKAAEGFAVALDADSCFHHSEQSRRLADDEQYSAMAKAGQGVEAFQETPVPEYPEGSLGLDCVTEDGEVFWVVRDKAGVEIDRHPECDCRFSISCKFHVFSTDEEASAYAESKKSQTASALTGSKIIRALVEDLQSKGKLPEGLNVESPLYQLAPVLVNEYVKPTGEGSAHLSIIV